MASLTSPGGLTLERPQRGRPRLDWWLVAVTAALMTAGLMALYSQGLDDKGGLYFRKQLLFVALGAVPFLLFALVNPNVWLRGAKVLYGLNLAALLAVLVVGRHGGGAERWIQIGPMSFEPSELSKLLTALTLGAFLTVRRQEIRSLSTFFLSLAHVGVPILLILKQPHLGAALVMMVIWCAMCLVARMSPKLVLGTIGLMAIVILVAVKVPGIRQHVLKGYQAGRVNSLLGNDTLGSNYQTLRAEIAFGEGGLLGSGYLHGEQKAGRYVPDQNTDFVFSVIGEEGGLIGCTLVLIMYGFFFYRIWLIAIRAEDFFNRLVCAGLLSMLAFQTLVNLAMELQLAPVVGLWLPFMSYGGSAIWLCMASVGLLLNLRGKQKPILF